MIPLPLPLAGAQTVPVHVPPLCVPATALLLGLLAETWRKRREAWALPSAFVYLTVLAWYFADLYITPESYDFLPDSLLNFAYIQVAVFLGVYRLAVPWLAARLGRDAEAKAPRLDANALVPLFGATLALWLVLMIYGVVRMEGDVLGALFPMNARAGTSMWARAAGADAGPTGFLVSAATYIHLLVCASFGVWFFFLRGPLRAAALCLMALTWPYFLLSGTRSIFLAVSLPFFFAYLLLARHSIVLKVVCLGLSLVLVDAALRTVIMYRNVGLGSFLSGADSADIDEGDSRHQGLNMIQELCFVDVYENGKGPEYGMRYLQELGNCIPRALWPSKPLLNVDYAIWRGFEGGDSDIGIVATLSTGMIGGGVLNFGPYLGPAAAAVLMALWTGLLCRWWRQRASFLRCFLSMAGLGLTFNLGRDITLLVLWPIVFGYALVRLAEKLAAGSAAASREAGTLPPRRTPAGAAGTLASAAAPLALPPKPVF